VTRVLLVDALATYRITRLLQEDSLPPLPKLRETILDQYGDHSAADLVTCPWCLSPWVAAAVLVARRKFPTGWSFLSEVLAISAAVGLLTVSLEKSP
jgi:hypothetical protein